jgi:hypothetical protein
MAQAALHSNLRTTKKKKERKETTKKNPHFFLQKFKQHTQIVSTKQTIRVIIHQIQFSVTPAIFVFI